MNEKMEQSLNWLGLTADEQAKVYKKIPDKAKKYGKFSKIILVINKKHKAHIKKLKIKGVKIINSTWFPLQKYLPLYVQI